ncbi:dihydropteroate synthase [Corynebacterium felinum]|uniref:dihydropteroate synthase n=1 Tax=Corynebacterium felinum TaxID=131318 RepID=A0ABU2B5F2_9CORY|nr:dihydropteroate synthase [Corynebacterium felinum]MDF5820106.1 dihydropteroate synthase [Corynebacterium felinum]MDR7353851.1 dihydropteroate synthase [Corynebacterium felinum]
MGIVNITEDSFSDGGRYLDLDAAIAHAHELIDAGADIIDIGGESTRPGAQRVDEEVELRRVIPVIEELSACGITTSVDTMRARVADRAANAGVGLINDVSGGLADPDMLGVMANIELPVCLMHWKTERFGDAAGAAHESGNIVNDVYTGLEKLVDSALAAGVKEGNISLDPGLGFAKTAENNWALLNGIPTFHQLGYPLLIGASRKRFIKELACDIDAATAAVSALSAHAGAWCVRVHDVASTAAAVKVAYRWNEGT